MKFNEDLAIIHSYICGDGYVIKNPPTQKHKYYYIGFRNTNNTLLEDFRERFERYFKIKVRLIEKERCVIQNKETYQRLIKKFKSFYSSSWDFPKMNLKLTRLWIRAFFDCEGWVFCKSKQNRHIGIDSINEKGLDKIKFILEKEGIKTIKKENRKRRIFRLLIYGKNNLKLFDKKIGFFHPEKRKKLKKALEDFVEYKWKFPVKENDCKEFILRKLKEKIRIRKTYYIRIVSKEKNNVNKLKTFLKKIYNINSLVYERVNGLGNTYYELNINQKEEIKKLIELKVIPNLFKDDKRKIEKS